MSSKLKRGVWYPTVPPGMNSINKREKIFNDSGVATRAHEREKVRAGTARGAALGYKLERLCRNRIVAGMPGSTTKKLV